MEEIFKGLVERAQYYEQFESFRNTNRSGHLGDMLGVDFKMKVLPINV